LKVAVVLLLVYLSINLQAQTPLKGRITDENGESIIGATVILKEKNEGKVTDDLGRFEFSDLQQTSYQLMVSSVGFLKKTIQVEYPETEYIQITLQEDVFQLSNIEIVGEENADKIRKSGYNVEAIDVQPYQDLNIDVNQILQLASGVNLRQSGGLGSNFELSLNGLSGNQVRYFIDGMPMEYFGSALSLNNMSANLIRNIEVYKGVVPVHLASDALGGSINIITPPLNEKFLDLSYSYGSFNTHRATALAQMSNDRGHFVRLMSFFNHSDNNYWMDDVQVTDELGNVTGNIRTRRFHDTYTSGALSVKTGVLNKSYADELSLQFTYAGNLNEIQHPDVSVNRVYGGLNRRSDNYIGHLRYAKKWGRISLDLQAMVSRRADVVYDTLSRRYNWLGEYKPLNNNQGEYYGQQSIFHIEDNLFRINANVNYSIAEGHTLNLGISYSDLNRKGRDEINENNLAFANTNTLQKQITGLSYDFSALDDKFRASLFTKYYQYSAVINTEEYVGDGYENVETEANISKPGYGLSISYQISPSLLSKVSFEKAYRLPEPEEILGDGMFVNPNPDLTTEFSNNVNAGLIYRNRFNDFSIKSELDGFYRPARDFIMFVNDRGIFGSYYNIANVRILGIESSNQISYQNKYILAFNWTYQSLTDQTPTYEGLPNTNYGRKIPNTPYFFWNIRLGYLKNIGKSNRLMVNLTSRYVHEFFLYWDHLGYKEDKNLIPTQFINDFDINYAFKEGKYSASLSVRNLFDVRAYDNFNIQKPGRAFYFKLRYFLYPN
jgi:outer membrane receptor protein involved in Fe transport